MNAAVTQPRRLKILHMSYGQVINLVLGHALENEVVAIPTIDLPQGTRVLSAQTDPLMGGFNFLLENEKWDEVPPFYVPPSISIPLQAVKIKRLPIATEGQYELTRERTTL